MCPAPISTSRSSRALETGAAKLWMLLVGVDRYQDDNLPPLRYSALDCQGLGQALEMATQAFPNREVRLYHDFAEQSPNLESVRASLQQITAAAKPEDTVLFYFSGHGVLDADTRGANASDRQQAVLCLTDTWKERLLETGLPVQELLQALGNCSAHQQLVWLDACHSGGMTLKGARGKPESLLPNPNAQLVDLLRQRAAQSQGFYALLSCDQSQRSWEFPELGHGVFTYYLMRGLRGEAVDAQGVIEADGLYKYVYHQTLQYIDKTNQQIRLVNQQKSSRGETQFQSEYPIQTPKRIVEGIGELVLGVRSLPSHPKPRQALIIDGLPHHQITLTLGKVLRGSGAFELDYLPRPGREWSEVRQVIQACLQTEAAPQVSAPQASAIQSAAIQSEDQRLPERSLALGADASPPSAKSNRDLAPPLSLSPLLSLSPSPPLPLSPSPPPSVAQDTTTGLLYIRGRIEETAEGETWLSLGDGTRLHSSWLRQVLRQSKMAQQIVILDCPGATSLDRWVDDLQTGSERGQCLIAAAAPLSHPDQFTQALLDTLNQADPQTGLTFAAWIVQLQLYLAGTSITPHIWLSAAQGVIDVLPGSLRAKNADSPEGLDLGLCPYMGLQAFSEENAQYFYGRDSLTQQLLEQLNRHTALAIVGASGSGKSSVVQAGLLAQLRQGKHIPGSQDWWMGSLRPGNRPLETLAKRLIDPGTEKEKAYQQLQIEGLLYQGVEGFVQWLRTRPEPMVVLVIDQFEELFTLATAPDRQAFLDLLLGALHYAGDRFKLVLTLRADFMVAALEIPELAKILQQASVLVPPYLTEDNYRQAIAKPAEQVGLKVEPGLVEVLMAELSASSLGGAGDLPLLEFVLEQLWQRRQSGQLTLEAYHQIGGLKGALERQAQSVYDSLDPEAQACAQWIFLALTHLGEGTEDTRRRILKSDLKVAKYPPPLIERTLQALTAAKLVVMNLEEETVTGQSRSSGQEASEVPPPSDTGDTEDSHSLEADSDTGDTGSAIARDRTASIEVAHEILIRYWTTLRWWLEENRARLRLQRQLEQAALLWKQRGQQPDFLLRGVRLAEAEDLYIKYTDELSDSVQQFIEACLEARKREERQAKQRLRRAQTAAVVMGGLGLIALVLGGLAYRQKLMAQMEQIKALDASSDALIWSNHQIESLVASLQAGHRLNQMNGLEQWLVGGPTWTETRLQTASTLQQAMLHTRELNRLEGHHQQVNTVSFSPTSDLIASGSDDGTVMLWDRNGRRVATLPSQSSLSGSQNAAGQATQNQPNRVTSLAFSPDGQTLATANSDRIIRLWRISGNTLENSQTSNLYGSSESNFKSNLNSPLDVRLIKTLTGHQDWVTSIQFNPNSNTLASASRDQTVKLWRLDGSLIKTLVGHKGWVNQVRFSADGKTLASVGEDQTIRLWRPDGVLIRILSGQGDRINNLTFSPDGQRLLVASSGVASSDAALKVWNLASGTSQPFGQTTASISDRRLESMNSLRFSPDGKTLATAGSDGQIYLWTGNGRLLQSFVAHQAAILDLSFSPDGTRLASASGDKTVRLFLVNGEALPSEAASQQQGSIYSARFNPIPTANPSSDTRGAIASDRRFATAGWDGTIYLWKQIGTTRTLVRTLKGHTSTIAAIAYSPDGKTLVSGSWDHSLKIWNLATGEVLATLKGHQDGVTSVAFSPDGKTIASGSNDKTIKLWGAADGKLLATLNGHRDGITSLAFNPNGNILASGSYDHTVILWQDGTLVKTLDQQAAVAAVQFSPDGNFLAVGRWDNTIPIWQVKDGNIQEDEPMQVLTGHQGGVTALAFSPDSQVLVSSSADGTLKLWNPAEGLLLHTLFGHDDRVNSVQFSPDNQTLISADDQGSVMLWTLDLGNLLGQACDRIDGYLQTNPNVQKGDRDLCP